MQQIYSQEDIYRFSQVGLISCSDYVRKVFFFLYKGSNYNVDCYGE